MDQPRVRKSEYVVICELEIPELPREVLEAATAAVKVPSSQLGQAGDASELVIRFDNLQDAVDLATDHEGALVFRLGPQVWPR